MNKVLLLFWRTVATRCSEICDELLFTLYVSLKANFMFEVRSINARGPPFDDPCRPEKKKQMQDIFEAIFKR